MQEFEGVFKCAYTNLLELHKIVPNPNNPNKHPDRQIELLAKIIDYQGQRSPIVISKRSGYVTKGHGRLMAIQKLGWSRAAVDFQDYDNEAQEYADLVADNKISELSHSDDDLLQQCIKSLNLDDNFDYELFGTDNLNFLLPDLNIPNLDNDTREKKYMFEAYFPNDMEMNDAKDELLSRGFIVKVKHNG